MPDYFQLPTYAETLHLDRSPSFAGIMGRPRLVMDMRRRRVSYPYDWSQGFRAGGGAYTPQSINGQNRALYGEMIRSLQNRRISSTIASMVAASYRDRRERYVVIERSQSLSDVTVGGAMYVNRAVITPSTRGEIHTHPYLEETIQPPSWQDAAGINVNAPIAMVAEGHRMWGVFKSMHCALLGQLSSSGWFEPLHPDDPFRNIAFLIS